MNPAQNLSQPNNSTPAGNADVPVINDKPVDQGVSLGDIDYLSKYHPDIDIEYYLQHKEVSPSDRKIILEKMYEEYINNIENIYKDFLNKAAKIRKENDLKKAAELVKSLGD